MPDERQGLPSASESERLSLCAAAFLRAKNQPDTTTAIAQTGTRIHEAVETGDRAGLTVAEEQIADDCTQLALIVHDECGFDPRDKETETIKEQRLWLTENGALLMSGKPDLVVIDGDRALVIDYKTGYLETLEASQNLQLRTLAVLVAANHNVTEVNVAIVQPNIKPGYSIARYDATDLEIAERQLRKILAAAQDVNAVATPGEKQCRYCKAKPVCKEAQEASFSVIEADMTTLDVVRLPGLLEKCDLADRVISAIRSAALGVVESGGTVEGWEMPSAGKSRSFTSPGDVFGAVADVVSREAFMGACEIKIGALEAAWLDTFDDGTKKDNLVSLKERLEPVTVWKDKTVRKLRRAKQ
jgi:hypothetical protein